MSTEEKPDGDEPEEPAEPEPTSDGTEEEPAKTDTTEEDLKSDATDQGKARQLARDNRARDDAVTALLGGTAHATNIFAGNVIGLVETGGRRPGDTAWAGVATGSVTDEALREVAATYVEPNSYGLLRTRLRERSVVLLRAKPGWGGTTTALHLLSGECAEGVEKLNPDVSLRLTKELGLRQDRGHLLEWLDVDEARGLHEFHLERLKDALDKVGGRMIVLLDPATPIREHALSTYVVEAGPAPDSRAVVARHFTAHLEAAGKPGQEVDDFAELADPFGAIVETERRVGNLAEFARDLGELVLGRLGVGVIWERYGDTADAAFREWFDQLEDNDQRSFAIALAVFNRMPMHTVAATATQLAKDMQAAENPDRRTRFRSMFALRRGDLLERVGAEVAAGSELTDLGPLAARVVRYRDDRRPRRLLEDVWWQFDEAHRVVRTWLHQLGQSPDRRVCARAGVTVGLLSLSEFDHVRQLVLEPWADANSPEQLEAVLGALVLPSQQPELQPLLARMIVEWLGSGSVGRVVAAVKALGTHGVVSPGRALKLMRRAANAKSSAVEVRLAVVDAVTSLAIIPDRLGQVLRTMLVWSDDLRIPVRNTGLLCLLRLSTYLQVSTEDSVEAWPALLHVAEHDPKPQHPLVYQNERIGYRRLVVVLLGRLLDAPFYMPSAIRVLRTWVEVAQKDPAQRWPLGRLLHDVAEETGDEAGLRHYLDEWATGRGNNNHHEAVVDILAAMDRRGHHHG
jgi:hypothetical protein